jgi:hypothetical protein
MDKNLFNKYIDMSLTNLKKEYKKCDKDNTSKRNMLKTIIKKHIKKNTSQDDKSKFDQINKLKKINHLVEKRGHMEKHWESHKQNDNSNSVLQDEINMDFSNNKLMERLNCELDFRINEKKSKEIIKPYEMYGDYESSSSDLEDYSENEQYIQPKDPCVKKSSRRLLR